MKFPNKNFTRPKNSSELDQIKAFVFDIDKQNILFNYSIINENNIEKKKILKFFISTLLECNVMVNETISYHSPDKIKSILHYLNTDKETRISPVGVYSSIGEVDYFAFQKTTKTFKVDFSDELTQAINANITSNSTERGTFRTFQNSQYDSQGFMELGSHKYNSYKYQINRNNYYDKTDNSFSNNNSIYNSQPSEVNSTQAKSKKNTYSNLIKNKNENVSGNNYKKTFSNNKAETLTHASKGEKSGENKLYSKDSSDLLNININKNNIKDFENNINNNFNSNNNKYSNKSGIIKQTKFLDVNLEYIYDAKHLIHSVSDFRNTPDFNNISYNYDIFTWHLVNENYDKSDEAVTIELFFDMEESFYNENIFMNLNFTKTIFLLNQTERNKLENSYTKLDTKIVIENSNYTFADGSIYLMEKIMNSSPDLDKLEYYVRNKKSNNKNDLIKIMKIQAHKILKYNETFQLEVKFPLYFENCRNYKTNTMIMLTGIILMVFLGSILYLIVSLNFSDKQ